MDKAEFWIGCAITTFVAIVISIVFTCIDSESTVCGIKIEKGCTKTYSTKDYDIVYESKGNSGLNQPIWELKEIVNKKSNSL